MKYFVVIFWALVIGQVVAFIATKLVGVPDNPPIAAIVSVVFGIFIVILEAAATPVSNKSN